MGTDGGGLAQYHDGGFFQRGAEDGLEHASIHALFEDPSGVLWVGADSGLFRLSQKGSHKFERVPDIQQ